MFNVASLELWRCLYKLPIAVGWERWGKVLSETKVLQGVKLIADAGWSKLFSQSVEQHFNGIAINLHGHRLFFQIGENCYIKLLGFTFDCTFIQNNTTFIILEIIIKISSNSWHLNRFCCCVCINLNCKLIYK